MILGSHVGMSGKEMMLGSVKEALSYQADTFMLYTGAPQNTRRKEISELRIEDGLSLMKERGIKDFIVHAPYIINLANTVNPDTYQLALEFLRKELERTEAMGSHTLVLHPGSHVGEGADIGIASIVKGLNEVLTKDTPVNIALETMAGKGSEVGRSFEELSRIFEGVNYSDKLRICFDTCHLNDAGYTVKDDFDALMDEFHRFFPTETIACIHLNDSLNPLGAAKDRHANIGFGTIGFDALCKIAHREEFSDIPMILETPYCQIAGSEERLAPYALEIAMLRKGVFDPHIFD